MANPIVIVNVSQQQAPLPNDLQKKGAFISIGGTKLVPGETAVLTQFADLAGHLAVPVAITSGSWGGGVATITMATPHLLPDDAEFVTTLSGCTPDGYNGTVRGIVTDADSFRFKLADDPGGPLVAPFGTVLRPGSGELNAMARTFFTQAALQSVSVIELGDVSTASALAVLQKFIDDNVDQPKFYSYLVPRRWDADEDFIDFMAQFESTSARTYFFITTNQQNWQVYNPVGAVPNKAMNVLIEAPNYTAHLGQALVTADHASGKITFAGLVDNTIKSGEYFTTEGSTPTGYNGTFRASNGTNATTLTAIAPDPGGPMTVPGALLGTVYTAPPVPPEEFSQAAVFHRTLAYDPSTTSRVSPLCFSFMYGVTRFPTEGNSAVLAAIKAGNVNYIGFGGEGGISNNMIVWGRLMDGRPWNYWYAVDWVAINAQLRLANTVINGSNTPLNPLYYDQRGIDRLEQSLYQLGSDAVSYGLALGDVRQVGLTTIEFANNLNKGLYAGLVIINAEPFIPYTRANPSDYRIGKYGGLAFVFTPQRGFEQIIVNVNVTDIVTP